MVFYSTKMMSLYTSVFASRDKVCWNSHFVTTDCTMLFQALDLYELQFVDEPDPLANYNLTKLTTELDKQIIEKWNQREYVPAYRYLLIRSLITKVLHVVYVMSCHLVCVAMESVWRGLAYVA